MADTVDVATLVKVKLQEIVDSAKAKFADKKITLAEGWQLLQESTAAAVYVVDQLNVEGADKKAMVLQLAQQLYDNVIAPIDIPFVPNFGVEPIVDKVIGQMIQPILGAMIEASLNLLRSGKTLAVVTPTTGSAAPK
jgi:hypothetical protein